MTAGTARVAILLLAIAGITASQIRYSSGQNVVPVYEGWERNPDGSFMMVFGYMNRNYEEQVEVPIGPDNKFEPGPADRDQPGHFYPRRQEFVFKVRVPKDWGDKDLVWTLSSHGKTEKAFGSLLPVWELGNMVYQENRKGAASLTYPEEPNSPPSIEMVGPAKRTALAGTPITLAVEVADDGNPKPLARPVRNAKRNAATKSIRMQSPASQAVVKLDPGVRLGVTWVVYRGGPGTVTLEPMRVSAVAADASTAVGRIAGTATTKATFSQPGLYVLRAYADDGVLVTPLDVFVRVGSDR